MAADYISFPKLGWTFHISPVIVEFKLFGADFSLKWYGLLIAIGFLLAVLYALKRVKDFKIDPDALIDVTLVSAIFAFLGARLYYVLFSDERAAYFKDPLSILEVWNGGLAIYGGIILAFVTAIWMCHIRKVNILSMFDISSLGFLIGQGIGRWGNFFNQEAFGGNTTLPWGMTGSIIKAGTKGINYDYTLPVHPTFFYESMWCLLGFILLHFISKKAYKFKGEIFTLYVMWYGAGRLVIEGLRTDSLYFGAIRISQLVAGLSILAGAIAFFLLRARENASPKELLPEESAGVTVPVLDESLLNEEDGSDESGASDEIEEEETVSDEDTREETTESTEEESDNEEVEESSERNDGADSESKSE